MFSKGIEGIDFVICNTDAQALETSPVPTKIILGATLTEGLGAGSNPEVGKNSAIETIDEIRAFLDKKTKSCVTIEESSTSKWSPPSSV